MKPNFGLKIFLLLFLFCRVSDCARMWGKAEEDSRVSQHPAGQPPAPGPPQQALSPGQPAPPGWSTAAGPGLCRGRFQAVSSQVRELHLSVTASCFTNLQPTQWLLQPTLHVAGKSGTNLVACGIFSARSTCSVLFIHYKKALCYGWNGASSVFRNHVWYSRLLLWWAAVR